MTDAPLLTTPDKDLSSGFPGQRTFALRRNNSGVGSGADSAQSLQAPSW